MVSEVIHLQMFRIREIQDADRDAIVQLATANWGSALIVSKGRVHDLSRLPGFIAERDGQIAGFTTYFIDNGECEITSVDSLVENIGVGTALVNAVTTAAANAGCRRVWLVTTNDNTRAIRFYQKRGLFCMSLSSKRPWHRLM